jgi:hypothetical protein
VEYEAPLERRQGFLVFHSSFLLMDAASFAGLLTSFTPGVQDSFSKETSDAALFFSQTFGDRSKQNPGPYYTYTTKFSYIALTTWKR